MNSTRYLPFVGRVFIGLPFMASGLSKLANYAGTAALIESSKLPLPTTSNSNFTPVKNLQSPWSKRPLPDNKESMTFTMCWRRAKIDNQGNSFVLASHHHR